MKNLKLKKKLRPKRKTKEKDAPNVGSHSSQSPLSVEPSKDVQNVNTELKQKDPKQKSFVIATLRRASYRWPARNEAIKKARIERGLYICNGCKQIFSSKQIQIDHIEPIIPVDKGFTTWDDYIKRLFCDADGFQVLCKDVCHAAKSKIESELRLIHRKKRKNNDKN